MALAVELGVDEAAEGGAELGVEVLTAPMCGVVGVPGKVGADVSPQGRTGEAAAGIGVVADEATEGLGAGAAICDWSWLT